MNDDLIKTLSKTNNPRATIYLNEKRVTDLYQQSVGGITEVVKTRSLTGKASAGLLTLFTSEAGGERATSTTIAITPMIMAILIEHQSANAEQLVDLAVSFPQKGALLSYVGDARLIGFDEAVTATSTNLSEAIASVIHRERLRQENVLRIQDANAKTIVWVSSIQGRSIASIASSQWVDFGHFCSYPQPPLGILGRYESESGGITFLSPLWIWHDGW